MSIWSSLYTSSSGISAYGNAMGVVGDNVANVGTTGFKGARAGFAAILGGIGANQQRVGAGVTMSGAEVGFGQGSLQQTGRPMDMAVWGEGFFVMQGNHQGMEGQYYTRDGRITADNEGFLVNPGGLRLQGYQMDRARGSFSPVLGDLQMETSLAPEATTQLDLSAQLDDTPQGDPPQPAVHETSVTVYDAVGRSHAVVLTFTSAGQGSDQWDWTASVDGAEINGGAPGTPFQVGAGTINYQNNGSSVVNPVANMNIDFVGTGTSQFVAMDFTGSTQYGDIGSDVRVEKDGHGAGEAEGFQIDEEGVIHASYSNGQTQRVGRVALADFTAVTGLERTGEQLYRETPSSGSAAIAAAATAGRGAIKSGVLEGSNVDLGSELVTMITYQRAFQANARAVSTADEMLAETANIKR